MIRGVIIAVLMIGASVVNAPLRAQEVPSQVSQNVHVSDAEIEIRARKIGHALRCVICQNQSIEESDASLAEDMRRLVRARIRAGETDAQIMTFMQSRYGDFVLLRPPVQKNTYILWGAPFTLILLGLLWFAVQTRKKHTADAAPALTPEEREALEALSRPVPQEL